MAAINKRKAGGRNADIILSSSEFPGLEVRGAEGNEADLRKKLNAQMKERRRKSGSVSGKMSPSKKRDKKEGRDIADVPTTNIGAQGAEAGGYKKKKPVKEKKLSAAARVKRGLPPVEIKKKGPAKMTGYGPNSGKQSIKDIIKEGIQEAKREEQPDDVATTGVEKPTNIAERYPSAIPEKPKLGGTRKSFHPTARKLQETALPPQLQQEAVRDLDIQRQAIIDALHRITRQSKRLER